MNGDLQKNSACQVIISREKSNEGEYSLILAAITTHKCPPEMVERAVKSVIAQTYTDWNLVVVDDSPADWELRDDVRKMVEGYGENDSRIRYVAHDRNYGAQRARNTALKIACDEGFEFIAYLDDDDEWLPEKLSKQLAKFQECGENTALVYCWSYVADDSSGHSAYVKPYVCLSGNTLHALLQENFIGSTSFPLIRAKYLAEVGGFDEEFEAAQDYDAWLRLAERFEVACVSEPLVVYHMHGGDNIQKSMTKRLNGIKSFMKKYGHLLKKDKYIYWSNLLSLSKLCFHCGEYKESVKAWVKAVSICPFRIGGKSPGFSEFYFSR